MELSVKKGRSLADTCAPLTIFCAVGKVPLRALTVTVTFGLTLCGRQVPCQVPSEGSEPRQCSCIVQADQAAVANHVGIENSDQPAPIA